MNDINKMPPVCAYCPYWEVCKPPYICPDVGEHKPDESMPDLQPTCNEVATDDINIQETDGVYEHCDDCIHEADSIDICILRQCKHAIAELKECYVPKQADRKRGKWIRQDNKGKPLYGWYQCSECGAVIGGKANFCSECGADMREVLEVVQAQPPAQPEIIRCRECKHYYFADNRIPQEQRYVCDIGGEIWQPDDFCSYGERREVSSEDE